MLLSLPHAKSAEPPTESKQPAKTYASSGDPNKSRFVQSASQSPSALGPPPPAPQASTAISVEVPTDTAEVVDQKVVAVVEPPSSAQLVRPNRFGRQSNSSSRHTSTTVQVLSTEEESKKKTVAASQSSPPAPGTDVPAPEAAAAEVPQPPSADLEEGELEYARTPSPPSSHATTTTTGSHAASHGQHSHGSTPALGPLLGRQPPHLNQGGSARGSYYQQGMSLPSPSSAAALAGAISPGTGFMPLALGGRPFQQHMVMQHAAAMQAHAQKVAAAAAAAGHSHMSPILGGGGGPAGAGNGVNNGPPGFGGYGVSPSVHGHHGGHMSQGPSPGAQQQGVASPSLLTTPRGGAGYHGMNTPWNMQR